MAYAPPPDPDTLEKIGGSSDAQCPAHCYCYWYNCVSSWAGNPLFDNDTDCMQ